MSPILEWFASESWGRFVEALLHTLWIGAVAAGLLAVICDERRIASSDRVSAWAAWLQSWSADWWMWAVLEQKAAGPRGPIPVERSSTESATEQPPALESATARAGLSPNAGSGGRGEFAATITGWHWRGWLAPLS